MSSAAAHFAPQNVILRGYGKFRAYRRTLMRTLYNVYVYLSSGGAGYNYIMYRLDNLQVRL